MAVEVGSSAPNSAKRLGWGLLALALATPVAMSASGLISAGKAGELTVQVGFAWLVAAVVIDLLTRKRDALAKANGRIVAAVLSLVMALFTGFNDYRDNQKVDTAKKELIEQFMAATVEAKTAPPSTTDSMTASAPAPSVQPAVPEAPKKQTSEADQTVTFLSAMKERAKKFAEESAALDRKFNSVDLSTILVPQNLISKDAIEASRQKLNTYKSLVAERDQMMSRHLALSEGIIRGSGLSESGVRDAMAGFNSSKESTVRTYADLAAAQLASVKASEDILNFAQRELGRITVQDGQPLFQSQPQLDEYQRLVQVLLSVGETEAKVTERVTALMQKNKQALVDQLK